MIYLDFAKATLKIGCHWESGEMDLQLSLRQETFCTSPGRYKRRWPGTQWCDARHCASTSVVSSPTIRHFH